MNTTDTATLTAALSYAARGWHVFPLAPESKRPAVPTHRAAHCDGTDPRCRYGHTGWEQRATTDPNRIARAWSSRPYGIGIACGPSGLLVIDTDTDQVTTGEDTLSALAAEHDGTLPETWTTSTPSGGRHRYYRTTSALGNSAGKLGPLVDTRGRGGYVVAPPTTTPTGRYQVTSCAPPAPVPTWLHTLLEDGRWRPTPRSIRPSTVSGYVAAALRGETVKVAESQPGQRNHTLFCAAVALGQLVAGGALSATDAAACLHDAASGHIDAGAFTTAEADATIHSGFRTGARTPRTAA